MIACPAFVWGSCHCRQIHEIYLHVPKNCLRVFFNLLIYIVYVTDTKCALVRKETTDIDLKVTSNISTMTHYDNCVISNYIFIFWVTLLGTSETTRYVLKTKYFQCVSVELRNINATFERISIQAYFSKLKIA